MRAPKLLPWIAHKNDITEQLALNLWRRAAGEAEVKTGCCDSSNYYRLAVSRFIELAHQEGEKRGPRPPLDCLAIIPDYRAMMREQNRLWQASQLAVQKSYVFWLSNLEYLYFGQNPLNNRYERTESEYSIHG